jgi:hypothetical protein
MARKQWTDLDTGRMIKLYSKGKSTTEIAAALGYGATTLQKRMSETLKNVANIAASKGINASPATAPAITNYQNPELINKSFHDLLSPPDSKALTDTEVRFCWAFVGCNNYEEAIEAANLDAGLFKMGASSSAKTGTTKIASYEHCLKLRIVYLKSKENILKFIKELRKSSVFKPDIDKDYLQQKIMVQLDSLETNPSADSQKLSRDYIQMLGRTFGGFTDKLEIGSVNHLESVKMLRKHASDTETLAELRAQKEKLKEEQAAMVAAEKENPETAGIVN